LKIEILSKNDDGRINLQHRQNSNVKTIKLQQRQNNKIAISAKKQNCNVSKIVTTSKQHNSGLLTCTLYLVYLSHSGGLFLDNINETHGREDASTSQLL